MDRARRSMKLRDDWTRMAFGSCVPVVLEHGLKVLTMRVAAERPVWIWFVRAAEAARMDHESDQVS
jgi:hypothetical protein